ncbi:hypothetical protein Sa4125_42010 [Aureimonas sp. SA4125]|uniref:type II toxin-antitoxin system RelE/ParE family toxin n=1 Tax=Aureimonas sp. SA4125 TaxID=2826993 RepID=UPI001CC6C2AE|nr:type II toxin-antitoxin system RelE/ParE family toxin [Aureimonas sp. SA4125]BDA86659.1 hypothetical protein Sa4125_42010 [Aureimonas sp. SA4125]
MTLIFRPEAANDLLEIARYSRRSFGKAQAKRYLRLIEGACGALADGRGQSAGAISRDLLKRSVASHIIFFRRAEEGVVVVRILHKAMNHEDYL